MSPDTPYTPSPAASRSLVLLVVAGVLWGTGGVTGAALSTTTELGAPAVAAYRLGLGGLVLVSILLVRRRAFPRSRHALTRLLVTGLLAAFFQSAYFSAVAVGTVSTATLITIGSAPMFVLLAQTVREGRLPAVLQIRPVAFGVLGLALLIGTPVPGVSLQQTLACATLAATSGAGFAALTLLGTRPLVDTDELTVTAYGFLFGGAVLAAGTVPFSTLGFEPSGPSLGLLLLFATVPTALAYACYFRGLRRVSAGTATVVALLEPLTATALAVLLLGERLTLVMALGAGLLLVSVVDSSRSGFRATGDDPARASLPVT